MRFSLIGYFCNFAFGPDRTPEIETENSGKGVTASVIVILSHAARYLFQSIEEGRPGELTLSARLSADIPDEDRY